MPILYQNPLCHGGGNYGIIPARNTQGWKQDMVFAFFQNIGPWQLIICLAVAFILFGGAKKIPELAKSLGKAKSEFKKGLAEGEKEEAEAETKKAEEPAKEIA